MSRYEGLAKKASNWSRKFDEYTDECKWFASQIAHLFTTYLEAPFNAIAFCDLDDDLKPVDGFKPVTAGPAMKLGKDGFWYFGLSMLLETSGSRFYMREQFSVGVQKETAGWIVKWGDDCYNVSFSNTEGIQTLFDVWVKQSEEMYDGPVVASSKAIGFLALK